MLKKALTITFIAAAFVAVGAGYVAAQEGSSPSGAQAAAAPPTLDQMAAKAREVLAKLDQSSQNVGRMLRDARAAKDVVKALCLDDKLSQVDVAKRSAADRSASLAEAAKSGNAERAQHDFEVIGALEERSNALSAEAQQCIGEEKGYAGGSSLKVTVDPSIPINDAAQPPPAVPQVIPAVPQAASPTF
jgi:hypothetical protein